MDTKKRPLAIVIIAIALFLAPLWIFGQVMFFNFQKTHSISGAIELLSCRTGMHMLLLAIISIIVGYGVYAVKKWGFYLLITFSVITLISNFTLLYIQKTAFSNWSILLFNLVILGVMVIFARKEIYAPYFNPELRWWEQTRRYYYRNMHVDIVDTATSKIIDKITVFDLSENGAYLVYDKDINIGDIYRLNIHISENENKIYSVNGEAMWINRDNASITHPHGFGCRFIRPDRQFKKGIKSEIKKIKSMIKRYYAKNLHTIVYNKKNNKKVFEGDCYDISLLGIFIPFLAPQIKENNIYNIELIFPENPMLETDAVVTWISNNNSGDMPNGFGCKFANDDPEFQKTIRHYIKKWKLVPRRDNFRR